LSEAAGALLFASSLCWDLTDKIEPDHQKPIPAKFLFISPFGNTSVGLSCMGAFRITVFHSVLPNKQVSN